MTWRHVAVAVALVLLVAVCAGAVLSAGGEEPRLGPYPTGDGDAVVVTPRAAP